MVIKADATVAKQGAVVNAKTAAFLQRMGIEPMRIGLSLVAVLEHGQVLDAGVLDIDEEKFMGQLHEAVLAAKNLAFNACIPLKDNIAMLIQKAHYDAAGLALEANLLTDENTKHMLAKAYWHAVGVAKYLPADMQAEDFSRFETTLVNGRQVRATVIERFEAIVHSAYFVPRARDVLMLEVVEHDVTEWMEPELAVSGLPEHRALLSLIGSLQLSD